MRWRRITGSSWWSTSTTKRSAKLWIEFGRHEIWLTSGYSAVLLVTLIGWRRSARAHRSSLTLARLAGFLCSAGMRCIKPLAPSRNETNSSRVNAGADTSWAILQILRLWRPDSTSYSATIRLTHYRILESPRLDKDTYGRSALSRPMLTIGVSFTPFLWEADRALQSCEGNRPRNRVVRRQTFRSLSYCTSRIRRQAEAPLLS